jgi:hypothetical protein
MSSLDSEIKTHKKKVWMVYYYQRDDDELLEQIEKTKSKSRKLFEIEDTWAINIVNNIVLRELCTQQFYYFKDKKHHHILILKNDKHPYLEVIIHINTNIEELVEAFEEIKSNYIFKIIKPDIEKIIRAMMSVQALQVYATALMLS